MNKNKILSGGRGNLTGKEVGLEGEGSGGEGEGSGDWVLPVHPLSNTNISSSR